MEVLLHSQYQTYQARRTSCSELGHELIRPTSVLFAARNVVLYFALQTAASSK